MKKQIVVYTSIHDSIFYFDAEKCEVVSSDGILTIWEEKTGKLMGSFAEGTWAVKVYAIEENKG